MLFIVVTVAVLVRFRRVLLHLRLLGADPNEEATCWESIGMVEFDGELVPVVKNMTPLYQLIQHGAQAKPLIEAYVDTWTRQITDDERGAHAYGENRDLCELDLTEIITTVEEEEDDEPTREVHQSYFQACASDASVDPQLLDEEDNPLTLSHFTALLTAVNRSQRATHAASIRTLLLAGQQRCGEQSSIHATLRRGGDSWKHVMACVMECLYRPLPMTHQQAAQLRRTQNGDDEDEEEESEMDE